MTEKRGRGQAPGMEDVVVLDNAAPDLAVTEQEIARARMRMRLRQRWELASVLHFLHVFEELIQSGLKMSGEEIEAGLMLPNEDLASLHIAILKGIPPVTKNLKESNAWVTAVCKKLASWWPWVAEGENPFGPDHREAIQRYKEIDATSRLLILKALCEVRAEQDDLLRYINDALKEGSDLSVFRKERIGCDDKGTTYWYDGDPVIGHRLYREIIHIEPKKRLRGRGSPAKPVVDSKWETLATNLEEFHKISENLSSGKIMSEVAVAKIINTDIIPVLEKFQKDKERALKRRQRESLLLDNILNHSALGYRCSHRERRPVKYTFDDYDRIIKEAIQISKKSKTEATSKRSNKKGDYASGQSPDSNGTSHSDSDSANLDEHPNGQPETDDDDEEYQESAAGDADHKEKDGDYNDTHRDGDITNASEKEKGIHKQKEVKTIMGIGLRRSGRTSGNSTINNDAKNVVAMGHAETKKRLRQRPTRNAGYTMQSISDTDAASNNSQSE